jgi:hypothetical protein
MFRMVSLIVTKGDVRKHPDLMFLSIKECAVSISSNGDGVLIILKN